MKELNLTEGPIWQKLIRFSLPMIAGNLLQQIYNIVDTLIVGRCLGTAYCIWRGCDMVFHSDWMVSGRCYGICFLSKS